MALSYGLYSVTASIPADAAGLSAGVGLGAGELVGIAMPAAWNAAALSFQASLDDVTYMEVQTGAAALSMLAAAGQFIQVNPWTFRGIRLLKVRSGLLGAAVQQDAIRSLILVMRSGAT